MSPTRRRFDGVQLRRNRSGVGVDVVFEPPSSPGQDDKKVGLDQDDGDPSGRAPTGQPQPPRPASRKPGRQRSRRHKLVKSVVLNVIGKEAAPVALTQGEIRIGSAPDSHILLEGEAVHPLHARVTRDDDGVMLRLEKPDLDLRLNHRQVESLAFLHDSDVIEIGDNAIAVQVESDWQATDGETPNPRATRVRRVPPKFVLRGVTGSQFGKLIPIYGRLVIGRGEDCDLMLEEPGLSRRHAVIETLPDGLFLRDLGSANGSYLNGVRVRDGQLKHGDQIVLDSVRFLVQAIDQLDVPSTPAQPAPRKKTARIVGWLLLAAALFMAGVMTALIAMR